MIIGWISGKLFEKAIELRGASLAKVAAQDILTGLWRVKNEPLGGLMAPRTFTEGQPSSAGRCWFPTKVENGVWAAPSGTQPVCAPHDWGK